MKTKFALYSLFFSLFALTLTSCLKDSCEREVTYILVEPVYKTLDEIRNGEVVNEPARELENPGKIYFYFNYLFINERREGVHVIDNSDPESPQNIAFIAIPGNEDIAIKDGILYANSYIDLLSIDIQDIQNATLVNREENVFPPLWEDVNNNRIAVYYQEEEVTEMMDCETQGLLRKDDNGTVFWFDAGIPVAFNESSVGLSTGGGTGVGGSMARFSIIGDYLYVVDDRDLNVFSLANATDPDLANTVTLGWGIETIFPYEDKLFIGSNTGMFIYDNSNPEAPSFLANFQHARACDPVFVKDNYAYVTLRDGTRCEGFNNQLDLVDITNITLPKLEKTFPMDKPHGLSIKDNSLFLCEGEYGLKVFDISYPKDLDKNLLDHKKGFDAFDAISVPGQENVLLVIGGDGFYQFNFDNPRNLKLISKILVRK